MDTITVEIWLYGPLARYAGDPANNIAATMNMEMPTRSTVRHVLDRLALPTEERGITFINGSLSAMPGVQPDLEHVLADGDRVSFFHLKSMWPFQYRHGVAMTAEFASATDQGQRVSAVK